MVTYEGLRLKILRFKRLKFAKLRKKNLMNNSFTIISNNCWGGMLYESYDLPKQSPTIGLYFMASDYIKFVKNLREYLQMDLIFIDPQDSKWKDSSQIKQESNFGEYPIGKLGDIEIFFLHYKSKKEALEKWQRRVKRVNWDRILIKFNDQNGCTEKDLEEFLNLPYKNKLFFTCKDWPGIKNDEVIRISQFPKRDSIMASYEPFGLNKYINITNVLNRL